MYPTYTYQPTLWQPFFFLRPFFIFLVPLLIMEVVLKGFSLWKAGRRNQIGWFVVLLIFNTMGVLPIIYLVFFQHSPGSTMVTSESTTKTVTTKAKRKK